MAHKYTEPPSPRLRGRDAEQRILADALGDARSGRGVSLQFTGGPGLGKTALLDHVRATAGAFTVLHAVGVADESGLALAGLHRLLRPVAPETDRLPEQQRTLLREALTLGRVTAADRFAVSAAVLDLVRLVAADRPLLLCVDDADLLDPPSLDALAFTARRLTGSAVALVLTLQEGRGSAMEDPTLGPPGLPEG
ncbi:ATP-binding protein [Nocardiopsis sp. MG754419]|uniref:ATP-binding protein n=1 Tax=Nocardiopsis sp. MG754419 TaxID=2259865 RepID=UPI001BABBE58|nr:ATP-binding protein [Nocardiopsis sp. MG754419]MBR8744496.1 hypothetical protein [Nocardiopsis sp. MG754419]